ncbi:hypothetical protein NQ315_002653 [Exocentrus adspersus]|uniref:Uncharacterized protein n=1 Tax=Exocentrus adspersus TaxID=1586481 RepID=A0AAV8VUR2_9CUCU|nr:hypothetical protein NQ315_002653 [Exocentrus adspersus]
MINEAVSEEVNINMALEGVKSTAFKSLEEASLVGPSTSKGWKRSVVDRNDDEANSNGDFLNPSVQSAAALSTRGKNMTLVRKATGAVSPTASVYSSFCSSKPLRRMKEFSQRLKRKMDITKKIKRTNDRISRIKGQKKFLRAQKETIREQIRFLDARELTLDERERSAAEEKKRYEVIHAKMSEFMRQLN